MYESANKTVVIILPQRKLTRKPQLTTFPGSLVFSIERDPGCEVELAGIVTIPPPRNITCMSCSNLSQVKEIKCNSRCTYSRQFHINEFLLTLSKTILFKNAIHSTRNLTNKVARADKGINFSRGSGKISIFCNADFIVFVYEITRF